MEKDCCMGCVYFYREAPYEITEEDKFDDRIPNDYRRDGMGTCHRWPPLAAELSDVRDDGTLSTWNGRLWPRLFGNEWCGEFQAAVRS